MELVINNFQFSLFFIGLLLNLLIIFILQIATIILSAVVFILSIAEVAIIACVKRNLENYRYFEKYRGNATIMCYPEASWGVGIWCSVLVSEKFEVVNCFNE